MTLTTQSIKAVAQGNGANTVWPFTFLIPSTDDVIVTLVTIASGNEAIVAPANYTVTGIGNQAGGSVTYPLSGAPFSALYKIVVERYVPPVQETDLTNQGGAYPADIEDALDYLTMVTQQLQDQVDRSIVFSVADTVEQTLPTATARAGKFLGFNSSGDPIAADGLAAGTTVSAAMIPVVTAATTALALTALGVPGVLLDLLIPSGVEWPYDAGGAAPTGFVYPIGQACTGVYPNYRAKLIAAGSPYGTNGVDPLMPDRRGTVAAGKSNMGGVDNGLLPGGTVLGAVLGVATANLALNQVPSIHSLNNTQGISVVGPQGHTMWIDGIDTSGAISGGATHFPSGGGVALANTVTFGAINAISVDYTNSSLQSLSKVQPTFVCNVILKVH